MPSTRVLITGGTGFLGAHCVAAAVRAGHEVRTTLRPPHHDREVRELIAHAGVDAGDALSVVHADLTADDGWAEAAAGCELVLHVASPFNVEAPEHEDDVIVPARDGALRVLRAARDAGARRVVLTSSIAAIAYGHPPRKRPFTEEDWTDTDAGIRPYLKSKAVAERAAWDFVAREGGGLELAVINPVGIFGPVLGPHLSGSIGLLAALVGGAMRAGAPDLSLGVVDVRDVADLHLLAATHPAAAGERFLASSGDALTLPRIAAILRERLPEAEAALLPTTVLGEEEVRAAAATDPLMAAMLPELGHTIPLSAEKAQRVLGWTPRPVDETLVATVTSLRRFAPSY